MNQVLGVIGLCRRRDERLELRCRQLSGIRWVEIKFDVSAGWTGNKNQPVWDAGDAPQCLTDLLKMLIGTQRPRVSRPGGWMFMITKGTDDVMNLSVEPDMTLKVGLKSACFGEEFAPQNADN
ncbi:MAG TPA: hypothetical protein PKO06_24055, partial [Candidatus Ozemobacteraceae bacterium]|nr:hypothetical protein [Candidatus Ozemobacteraceae bacterium]